MLSNMIKSCRQFTTNIHRDKEYENVKLYSRNLKQVEVLVETIVFTTVQVFLSQRYDETFGDMKSLNIL